MAGTKSATTKKGQDLCIIINLDFPFTTKERELCKMCWEEKQKYVQVFCRIWQFPGENFIFLSFALKY